MASVLVGAGMLTGCSGSQGSGGTASDTLMVYTGQAGDWQSNFNPYSPSTIAGPGTIYEPLFFYNQAKAQDPVPLLGTEHSWNTQGTLLKVTTRSGVTWSDGTPFTARDVAFTFDMIAKNPAINAGGYKGKATAIDDTHVEIAFDSPSFMDESQILGKQWIMPEHLWKSISEPAKDTNPKPVGTGPYVLDTFKPQVVALKANPTYWRGEADVKKIRYLSLSGNQAGEQALRQGKIDWQTGPVPDLARVSTNYPGYKVVTTLLNQTALFTCSNEALGCKGAQTDPAVRKAIYYAMDRGQINKLAFQNTSGEISPGMTLRPRDAAFSSPKLTEQTAPMSPATGKAEALLTAAGYAKGPDGVYAKNGKRLSFTVKVVSGWTDYITALTTMTEQLKKVGIELTPVQQSWNEWSSARNQGEYELLLDSLYPGPIADPYHFYQYWFASGSTAPVGQQASVNYSRFSNPAVDAALAELKTINPKSNAARRQELFDTIQVAVEDTMPYIPILTAAVISEYNDKKFTGWPTAENMYAVPAVWQRPDDSQVYYNLKVRK